MKEEAIAKHFGDHLKVLRTSKGLSQEKLAFLSKLHPTYISLLERGKRQPSLSSLISISKALEVSISDLLKPFA